MLEMSIPGKQEWIKRAEDTYDFHRHKLVINDGKWTIRQTAKLLRRSLGGVTEDLMIAKYLKKYRPMIERFGTVYEALKFIRRKKKEMQWEDLE